MPKSDLYVNMVHKDFSDRPPTKVLKTTFNKTWKEKGWEIAKEDKAEEKAESAKAPSTTPSTPGG